MHPYIVGQRGKLAGEPVPPGDLERHLRHLPRPARHGQRALDPADLQHEDQLGADPDRLADRDRVDDAAVDEMLAVDLHRRQQPRHGRRRQHRVDQRPAVEPVLGGPLDAGRAAPERDLQIGERRVLAQLALEQPAQRQRASADGSGRRTGASAGRSSRRTRSPPRATSRAGPAARSRPRSGRRRPARRSPRRSTCRPPRRAGSPARNRARSMPTSTAPSTPPPPSTNATGPSTMHPSFHVPDHTRSASRSWTPYRHIRRQPTHDRETPGPCNATALGVLSEAKRARPLTHLAGQAKRTGPGGSDGPHPARTVANPTLIFDQPRALRNGSWAFRNSQP